MLLELCRVRALLLGVWRTNENALVRLPKMSSTRSSSVKIRRPGPVISALSVILALFLAFPPQSVLLAGDILRGGSPGMTRHGAVPSIPTAAAVMGGAPSGTDTLARTTQ